ncbi:putative reverse transcriptase domain-containing protein [Tanacetum coccineum]
MQEVVLFYNGLDVPTRQPLKTVADAKVAIQAMPEYSQKWHNGTTRTKSTETSDGLAAIQAQLNNLGREIKKVFVILDMPEDFRVPIILGRPFFETARAMIDVFNKTITLKVGDDEVIFDMDQSIKRPLAGDDKCYGVDDLDDAINAQA